VLAIDMVDIVHSSCDCKIHPTFDDQGAAFFVQNMIGRESVEDTLNKLFH